MEILQMNYPLGLVHNKVNSGGIAPEYCILLYEPTLIFERIEV
jgi:hypothetical protein